METVESLLAFVSSFELIGFISRTVYGIAAGRSTAAVVYSLKADVDVVGSGIPVSASPQPDQSSEKYLDMLGMRTSHLDPVPKIPLYLSRSQKTSSIA